ncbi:hypothetical protein GGR36_001532 [Niveibacterium umoris]|uniref:Uncharacterized protein n=1 Tax=Niveibacterium umoris TaxID=1193620 RepID=A0A840BIQ7_9RHOO|nr:hypothetical protein [Niveibacterium umoris]
MCRLQMRSPRGAMQLKHKGQPDQAPQGGMPWFRVSSRASASHTVVFGRGSVLGFHQADGILGLNTGCVWGGCPSDVWSKSGERIAV